MLGTIHIYKNQVINKMKSFIFFNSIGLAPKFLSYMRQLLKKSALNAVIHSVVFIPSQSAVVDIR